MTRRVPRHGPGRGLHRADRGGRSRILLTSFDHDGHNLMRYRPEAVTAAILSIAGATGRHRTEVPMQVVYSSAHLGHDITVKTYMGSPVPANEVAERAERIRTSLEADGGFPIHGPTEHGLGPIVAVHDPGLVRFLERSPGPSAGHRGSIDRT